MTLPPAILPAWHPCKGCACVNHTIPSYRFFVTDADSPIADHPDLGPLTRSNATPNPSEEKTLQQMISDSGKRIDNVDDHVLQFKALRQSLVQSIARVDEQLAALDNERQRLFDSIRERQRLLSALRRMPKEVLAHIFFDTIFFPFPRVQPSTRTGGRSAFSPMGNPLLSFALVSQNWNDVLVAYPSLWSYVNIVVDRLPSSSYARCIGKHISRSGQSPLSVSISHTGSAAGPGALPDAVLTTLFTARHRIICLHLHLPGRYFPSVQQLPLSFPILRELHLHSSSDTADVGQHLDFDLLPDLQVLDVMDISNIHSSSPPWHQITRFSNTHVQPGHGPLIHFALTILTAMSRLSVCRLFLDLQPLINGIAEETTTLTELKSLSLSSVYRQGFGLSPVIPFLLDHLTLPVLSDLSVTCLVGTTSRDQDTTFTSICRLVERCNCPLTSLSFSNGGVQTNDLIFILTSMPALQDLRLTNIGRGALTEHVLDYLATIVSPDTEAVTPAFIPCLHTLHLIGHIEFSTEALIEMIESRWKCDPCHLKSVNVCRYVDWRREKEEETITLGFQHVLAVLRSEGLDVTVNSRRMS
ncbi:uncharacterized protein BT62DRAFT_234400 [Guyanagaster necrorhizus]|uniref:F-box domain-containing protein n=1 Tax=Guyanagaster necrorhizus TaxID=856835 RepID=A0A9P7VPL9_9AGAR|nr:uncharacterized protein BT62DRAFT_234400 [Guyanagaster necrorhizus MCA 3950]KAG7444282.1 hypothetical protein BT62DRAFT_234400 [Guyanagaster necrorhizus MCA 3950]